MSKREESSWQTGYNAYKAQKHIVSAGDQEYSPSNVDKVRAEARERVDEYIDCIAESLRVAKMERLYSIKSTIAELSYEVDELVTEMEDMFNGF